MDQVAILNQALKDALDLAARLPWDEMTDDDLREFERLTKIRAGVEDE